MYTFLSLGFAHKLLCFQTGLPVANRLCYFLENTKNASLVDGHYLELKPDFQLIFSDCLLAKQLLPMFSCLFYNWIMLKSPLKEKKNPHIVLFPTSVLHNNLIA